MKVVCIAECKLLTIGKTYTVVRAFDALELIDIIADDGETHLYHQEWVIPLEDYREEILSKLII